MLSTYSKKFISTISYRCAYKLNLTLPCEKYFASPKPAFLLYINYSNLRIVRNLKVYISDTGDSRYMDCLSQLRRQQPYKMLTTNAGYLHKYICCMYTLSISMYESPRGSYKEKNKRPQLFSATHCMHYFVISLFSKHLVLWWLGFMNKYRDLFPCLF